VAKDHGLAAPSSYSRVDVVGIFFADIDVRDWDSPFLLGEI
jgi:hypothetical protein